MTHAQLAKQIRTGQHVPDILDCLAQLSNDEVPTPPKLAREMLSTLPAEVWSNPDLKWLDPFCKSGVFLREAAARLLDGLSDQIPDFEERRNHIYRDMLWGTSITEMTGMISRRSLYYSRDASGPASVVSFDSVEGNLTFVRTHHTYPKKKDGTVTGGCAICGAPFDLERGEARENHAYSFIHDAYPTEEMRDMKFDVIVGNPPYQVDSDGNTRTRPIYQVFVERAIEMRPKYVLMITPSRWFAGGLGLDEFRAKMLNDRRIRALVDYRVEKDAFPGVNINGGVSYFLWDRDHDDKCAVRHFPPGGPMGDVHLRHLNEFDMLIRQNEAVEILRKVQSKGEPTFAAKVSPQKPFDFHTDFHGAPSKDGLKSPLRMFGARKVSWVERDIVVKNRDWIDTWKVFLAAATDGNENLPLPVWDLAVGPFVGAPGEICSGSYLTIAPGSDEVEARRTAAYLRTRFLRFLVSLRKIAQHNTTDRFAFVPDLPMDQIWTDEALYERYGITADEVSFIESQVKEMPSELPVEKSE